MEIHELTEGDVIIYKDHRNQYYLAFCLLQWDERTKKDRLKIVDLACELDETKLVLSNNYKIKYNPAKCDCWYAVVEVLERYSWHKVGTLTVEK